jgi:hypothetical protein
MTGIPTKIGEVTCGRVVSCLFILLSLGIWCSSAFKSKTQVSRIPSGSFVPDKIQDNAVFGPSDFAIIDTDGQSEFDIENHLTLRDAGERKLNLRLNYVYDHDNIALLLDMLKLHTGDFPIQVAPLSFKFTPHILSSTRPAYLLESIQLGRRKPAFLKTSLGIPTLVCQFIFCVIPYAHA